MNNSLGILLFALIGFVVFSIPATIRFIKWLKQRREKVVRG